MATKEKSSKGIAGESFGAGRGAEEGRAMDCVPAARGQPEDKEDGAGRRIGRPTEQVR